MELSVLRALGLFFGGGGGGFRALGPHTRSYWSPTILGGDHHGGFRD